jgi:UDP-glucose 4-epimerase
MGILVTGGAGYIGSHFVKLLKNQAEPVYVIDNLSTGNELAVTHGELFIMDLNELDKLDDLLRTKKIHTIVHFAGSIVVPESIVNPQKYFNNNTTNTTNLVKLALKNNVKNFIFSSTAAVYGDCSICTEDTPQVPVNPYGMSKLLSEKSIKDLSTNTNLKYIILRYFNVAGADPDGEIGQSFPGATHLLQVASEASVGKRKKVEIFGTDFETRDGTCIRDYIHVSDLVQAHLDALLYLKANGESEILNCGYGTGYTVKEVLNEVLKQAEIKFEVVPVARREGDPAIVMSNNSKIKKILKWNPLYNDLSFIVKTHIGWQKNRRY